MTLAVPIISDVLPPATGPGTRVVRSSSACQVAGPMVGGYFATRLALDLLHHVPCDLGVIVCNQGSGWYRTTSGSTASNCKCRAAWSAPSVCLCSRSPSADRAAGPGARGASSDCSPGRPYWPWKFLFCRAAGAGAVLPCGCRRPTFTGQTRPHFVLRLISMFGDEHLRPAVPPRRQGRDARSRAC